jgi:hypothetical protein
VGMLTKSIGLCLVNAYSVDLKSAMMSLSLIRNEKTFHRMSALLGSL